DAFSTNLQPSINAQYDIIKNKLKYVSNASVNFVGENGLTFYPPEATGVIWNDALFNSVSTRDFERMQMVLDNTLQYNHTFGKKIRTNWFLGNTFNTFRSDELRVGTFATGSSLLHTLGSSGGYSRVLNTPSTETILSFFTKADMVYNDRYGFNVTVRRDGS